MKCVYRVGRQFSSAIVCLLLISGMGDYSLRAEDVSIASLLGRSIIDPKLSTTEVQDYAESRVPLMPPIDTVDHWEKHAGHLRRTMLEKVVFRGEAARWREAKTKVEWLDTIPGGSGYQIRKLRYEALPGLWIPAILYEPMQLAGRVPVVLNVNGHEREGKSAPYKQIRCINQAKRGMLALNVEWLGMGQLKKENFSHSRMNQMDLCGTSGLALFYLAMKRALDLLLEHPHADPAQVAVAGLSGGGWQTIIISALDTRVILANPVAGYSSFRTRARFLSDLGDSEQTPVDMATVLDYTHLTAMRAPRPTLLTYNAKDQCCFRADHALEPLLKAAKPVFELYGEPENLRWHINEDPGTHNFEKENREMLYLMLRDHFSTPNKPFDAKEIECENEIKSADELLVPLPEDNADFHTLALALSRDLPRSPAPPQDKKLKLQWQKDRRSVLRELVHFKSYEVKATCEQERQGDLQVSFWGLKIGEDWTVPAVGLMRDKPTRTAIVIADSGRKEMADQVSQLLSSGGHVLAVDPFYFGESEIHEHAYLFALLVSAVGERPLGIQASQLAAIARWARSTFDKAPVSLVAVGPRTGVAALVAAALEPEAIGDVELYQPLNSLKDVIEKNWEVTRCPELFCFGLLEQFDIKNLVALIAPRKVVTHKEDEQKTAK